MKTPKYLLALAEQYPSVASELRRVEESRLNAYTKIRMLLDPVEAKKTVSGVEEVRRVWFSIKDGKDTYSYELAGRWGAELRRLLYQMLLRVDDLDYSSTVTKIDDDVAIEAVALQQAYDVLHSFQPRTP